MEQERLSKLAGITEIEVNAGDDITNSLDSIDEYVSMLEDEYVDIREIQADIARGIQNAVEEIRTRLNDLND
ncbi:uncharacterized protein METZ01_LOCUS94401 [marine metagenome]|uniref:Uncharacterized protein n=1 Tax=marine metagenome TaxID=408172 RepID=A0A381VPI6_9ZZZZ|tara:strand:+ start:159 stop:374 length:216 start_codon:yes stop_codon:yes gene_type:complete